MFQATEGEFAAIFPADGQDMEFIEDFIERVIMAARWVLVPPVSHAQDARATLNEGN